MAVKERGTVKMRGTLRVREWTPADLGSVRFGYDASRLIGYANNDPVAAWADVDDQDPTIIQANAANQPLYIASMQNGKPGVRFDGVNDTMSTTPDPPSVAFAAGVNLTFIFVGAFTSPAASQYYAMRSKAGTTAADPGWSFRIGGTGDSAAFLAADGTGQATLSCPTPNVQTGPHVYYAEIIRGGTHSIWRDDSTTAQDTSVAAFTGAIDQGGTGFFRMSSNVGGIDTLEAWMFATNFDSTTRAYLFNHFGKKWGITVT